MKYLSKLGLLALIVILIAGATLLKKQQPRKLLPDQAAATMAPGFPMWIAAQAQETMPKLTTKDRAIWWGLVESSKIGFSATRLPEWIQDDNSESYPIYVTALNSSRSAAYTVVLGTYGDGGIKSKLTYYVTTRGGDILRVDPTEKNPKVCHNVGGLWKPLTNNRPTVTGKIPADQFCDEVREALWKEHTKDSFSLRII